MQRVGELIAGRTAAQWEPIFLKADCCCTVVRTLDHAMNDPHFVARGVFSNKVSNAQGQEIVALPTPITANARAHRSSLVRAPALGEHTRELLESQD